MPLLNSSAIRRVEYDPSSQTLQIWFTSSGQAYSYHGVPEDIYRGLINAGSPGSFYDRYIRDRYR